MDDRNQNQNPEHRSVGTPAPEQETTTNQDPAENTVSGPEMPNQPGQDLNQQIQNENGTAQPPNYGAFTPPQNNYGSVPPQNNYGSAPPQAPWQQNQNPQQNDPYYNPYYQTPPPGNYYQQNDQNQPPQGNPYDPYNQSNQPNQPVQKPPVNHMAVTSMVLGIVSLLVSCCCLPVGFIGGFAIGMAGLATAIISKKGEPFSPFAVAGLIVSILGICGSLLIFGCYILTANLMKDPEYAALFNEILQQYYNGN